MATADTDLFGFINDLYGLLPESDQIRFGELWTAYEQTLGDVWTRLLQSQLSSVISTLPLYNTKRWLQHAFDSSTAVELSATYTTNQDISQGLNLTARNLIRFSVDGAAQVEVNLTGANPNSTTNLEILSKINAAAGFDFATLVVDNALIQFNSPTRGVASNITFYPASNPAADASAIILGLDPATLPLKLPEFAYSYALIDSNIASIPKLQDKIRKESVSLTLTEGTNYTVSSGLIFFASPPPALLWAPDTLYNFETPYNNYGFLIDFYDKNSAQYLKAVQGLWFAYWTGPRPENIKRSLYLLCGLPTASDNGTVSALTTNSITLTYTDGAAETFTIPKNLLALVGPGDPVTKYQPLTTGITVLDKVNSPGFLAREVGRTGVQRFLTQNATHGLGATTDETKALKTVEQNTYLPQIDVNAFVTTDINLGNIKTFLTNMQPKSRTFLLQILVGNFSDELVMDEIIFQSISMDVTPNLDYNPNTYAQQSDLTDAEIDPATGMVLDSEAFIMVDYLSIDVYQSGTLTETLHIEG